MMKTSVVILNYNGEKFLRQFLPVVVAYTEHAEVVVVDNKSTDCSVSVVKDEFPQVRLITLDRNYGFCGGYNLGLRQVEAEYFILLNSDIEVTKNWHLPLVELLDGDPAIAAVQPKILAYNDKTKFEYAGAGGGFIDALGYPFCRGRIFNYVESDLGQYDDDREVFWATGACLAIRSAVFYQLGGFDEDFFAHMEEIDLCWKINRIGRKVYYCGRSKVYHVGAGTLGYESAQKTYLNFRNGLALIFKHLTTRELMVKLPLRIALDWLAVVVFLLKSQWQNGKAVLRAHRDFFGAYERNLAKRRFVKVNYPRYSSANIFGGLIIFRYYILLKKRFQ